ncbi:leucine rich repeat protein 1 [Cichlidogyrus casuarinus]|uniref:Leucine rich repeat protein 1 n=1 Tax=Cichlidogyrus casuarinus TaxID=1844966 RepID=A0ABD2QMR0_9PLAT
MFRFMPKNMQLSLDCLRTCQKCSKPCGIEPYRLLLDPINSYKWVDIRLDEDQNKPFVISYLCSFNCLLAYRRNPWKYSF